MTDTDGVLHFAYPLAYGDYTLVEVAAPYGYWLGDAVNGAVQDIVNWLAGLLGGGGRFDAESAKTLTDAEIQAYATVYAQYEPAFTRWQNDMQRWYAALAQLANDPASRSYLLLYESRPQMPQAPLRLAHDTLANGNADVAAIKASALYKQHPQLFAWLDDYAPTSNIVNFSIRSTDKTYPLQNATQGTVENDAGHSNAHYAYNKILALFVANEAQKGYVELTKTGLQLTGAAAHTETHNAKPYTLMQPVWQTLGLADARYTITAAADIVTPDGTLRHKAGALVATLVTNADGVAISQPLHLGEYILQETKAPYGYVLDEMEYPFTLEYQGQNIR
ncbi:MAG: prealbumin-like fold domain-containing protein, partial [Ruthenibacterium sp.]